MARYDVTSQLSEGIRNTRNKNNIVAKDLAMHIEKSPAYITKLEKGEIKSIEDSELLSIINYVVPGNCGIDSKIERFVEDNYPLSTYYLIDSELWLKNYAWTVSKLIVPQEMQYKVRQWLEDERISIDELYNKINSNISLTEMGIDIAALPNNQWCELLYQSGKNCVIKLYIEHKDIYDFIYGDSRESTYLLAYVVVRFMSWMTRFPDTSSLTYQEEEEINSATVEFLDSYEFMSIEGRYNKKAKEQLSSKLETMFFNDSYNAVGLFYSMINISYAIQPLGKDKALRSLTHLEEMLKWDPGFVVKMLELPFIQLGNISFTNKKRLLNDIYRLVESYSNMPDQQKCIEDYD